MGQPTTAEWGAHDRPDSGVTTMNHDQWAMGDNGRGGQGDGADNRLDTEGPAALGHVGSGPDGLPGPLAPFGGKQGDLIGPWKANNPSPLRVLARPFQVGRANLEWSGHANKDEANFRFKRHMAELCATMIDVLWRWFCMDMQQNGIN